MEAPSECIGIRTSYNLSGCDFTPGELTRALQQCVPGFDTVYAPITGKTSPHLGPTAWTTATPDATGDGPLVTTFTAWWHTCSKAWRNNPTLTSWWRTCDAPWFGLYFRVLNLN